MNKVEGRAVLKRLQAIVNFKGDEEAESVLAELRAELASMSGAEQRSESGGRDRKERKGRDRSED